MTADHRPGRLDIGDGIRILVRGGGAIPDARAPIVPAADSVAIFGINEDARTELAHPRHLDARWIEGDAGEAIIVGHRRKRTAGHVAQRADKVRNDKREVGNIGFVEHAGQAALVITGIVEHARKMREIIFARPVGEDARQKFVAAAKSAANDMDSGLAFERCESAILKGLGYDAAPPVEPDAARAGPGRPGEGSADDAGRHADRRQPAQKAAPSGLAGPKAGKLPVSGIFESHPATLAGAGDSSRP